MSNIFNGEVHPCAELLPLMAGDELQGLAADIAANGLLDPLLVDPEGRLLDGRNRLAACRIAGVEPRFERVEQDALMLVIAKNVRRRQLTKSQLAIVAVQAWEVPKMAPGEKRRDAVGRTWGVSNGYIQMARSLVEHDPEAAQMVLAGEVALGKAYEEWRKRKKGRVAPEQPWVERFLRALDGVSRVAPQEIANLIDIVEEIGRMDRLAPERVEAGFRCLSALLDNLAQRGLVALPYPGLAEAPAEGDPYDAAPEGREQ